MTFDFFKKITVGLLAFFIAFSPLAPVAHVAYADINPEINYQGKLLGSTGSAVSDGTYEMTFSLYTASSGGSAIWTETRTGADEVDVVSGLFSVMLGEVSSLSGVDFNQPLWLGVTVESDSEMTPRKRLGTVPAAFVAQNSIALGNATSTQYLRSDVAGMLSVSSSSTGLIINQSGSGDILNLQDGGSEVFTVVDGGNVGIGTTTPGTKLAVAGTARITGASIFDSTLSASGAVTFSSTLGVTGHTTLATASSTNLTVSGNSYLGTVQSGTWNGSTISSTYLDSSLILSNEIDSSLELAGILGDETGSGSLVFGTSPTFTTNADFFGDTISDFTGTGLVLSGSTLTVSTSSLGITSSQWTTSGSDVYYSAGKVSVGTTTPATGAQVSIYGNSSIGLHVTSGSGSGNLYGVYAVAPYAAEGISTGIYGEGADVGISGYSEFGNGVSGESGNAAGVSGSGLYGVSGSSNNASGRAGYFNQSNASGYSLYATGGINYIQNSLGIGTTTPAAKLHVDDATSSTLRVSSGSRRVSLSAVAADTNYLSSVGASLRLLSSDSDVQVWSNGAVHTYFNTSGQLLLAGTSTAALPGISTYAYNTSGLFFPSSGVLGFSTASTERMRIDSSGNVGIGTTTPANKLAVSSDGHTVLSIDTTTTSNSARLYFTENAAVKSAIMTAGSAFATTDRQNDLELFSYSGDVSFWPGGAQAVTFKSGGNVGIGTSTPTAKLDIYEGDLYFGSSTYNTTIKIADIAAGNTLTSGSLTISAGSATNGSNMTGGDLILKAGNSRTGATHSSGNLSLYAGANNFVSGGVFGDIKFFRGGLSGAYTQAMTLNGTTGNLGIGTTTPVEKLQVHATTGQVSAGIRTSFTDATSYGEWNVTENGSYKGGLAIFGSNYTTATWRDALVISSVTNNTGSVIFRTRTGGNYAERMIVTNAGKVGIGTTTPTALLDLLSTTEQVRVGYDALNYYTTTVGSSGLVTFNAVGSGSGFSFTDSISTDGLVRLDGSAGNDYIWHSGSNKVHIATAGFDRLTVDGSGNVGIGTTTPTDRLHVSGNALVNGTVTALSSGAVPAGVSAAGYAGFFANSNFAIIGANNVTDATRKFTRFAGAHYTNSEEPVMAFTVDSITANSAELYYGGGSSLANSVTGHRWYTASNSTTVTGTERMYMSNTGLVVNDLGNDFDFRVEGDTDAGLFSVDAGLDSVGIGTTTPGYKLTVAGDASITGALRFGGDAGTSGYILQTTGSSAQWVATSTLGITSSQWTTSGSDIYYHTSGNVGIGTSSPDAKLAVYGKSDLGGTAFLVKGATGIGVFNGTAGDGNGILMTAGNGGDSIMATGGNGGSIVLNPGAAGTGGSADGSVGNIILANLQGSVGIGTDAPGKLLDVNGDVRIRGDNATLNFYRSSSPTDIAYLQYDNASSTFNIAANNKSIRFLNGIGFTETLEIDSEGKFGLNLDATSLGVMFGSKANSDARMAGLFRANSATQSASIFGVQNHDGLSSYLTVDADGDVGVGTSTPDVRFQVSGGSIKLDNNQKLVWRNAAGSANQNVLHLDSANNTVLTSGTGAIALYDGSAAHRLDVYNGATVSNRINSNGTSYINGGDLVVGGTSSLGRFTVYGTSTSQISQVIRMATSQTADSFVVEDSAGNDLLRHWTASGLGSVLRVVSTTTKYFQMESYAADNNYFSAAGAPFTIRTSGGAYNLNFFTNSTDQRMAISASTGHVIVGSTATNGNARVHSIWNSGAQLRLGVDTSNTAYMDATVGSTGVATFDASGSAAAFSFSDSVGIGTTSPSARLAVTGASGSTNNVFVVASSTNAILASVSPVGMITANQNNLAVKIGGLPGSEGSYSGVWLGSGTPSASNYAFLGSSQQTFFNAPNAGLADMEFRIGNTTEFTVGANGAAVGLPGNTAPTYPFQVKTASSDFIVNSSGNVGIGTTTPDEILAVAGNINLTGALKANGSAGTSGYLLQTTGTGVQWVATSTLGISGGGGSSQWTTSGSDIYYDDGAVSVGTTTPFANAKITSVSSAISSSDAYAVRGYSYINDGSFGADSYGGYFVASGADHDLSVGVYGQGDWTSNYAYGVWGNSAAVGVYGTGDSIGVQGTGLTGVYGTSNSASGKAGHFNQSNAAGYSLYASGGVNYIQNNLGLGVTSASARLHVISTTEQLRVGYDASNYLTVTVASDGAVTFDGVGTDPEFSFSDNIGINTASPATELDIYGSNGGAANIYLMRNDSTTVTDDELGGIAFGSSDGPSPNAAAINAYASENYSSSNAGSYLVFRTSQTGGDTISERMRITDAGNIGIGTTSPQRRLHVLTTADEAPVRFEDSSGYCEINPISTTWSCTSDERLKDNIRDLASVQIGSSTDETILERVSNLRPVAFTWRSDEDQIDRTGLIAQEVEKIFPDLVNTDERGYKSVSYGGFTVYLIGALKELVARLENVENAVASMSGTMVSNVQAGVSGIFSRLTVGSAEKPTGITLYDEETGEPYCLKVRNGETTTTSGECTVADLTPDNAPVPPAQTDSGTTTPDTDGGADGGGGQSAGDGSSEGVSDGGTTGDGSAGGDAGAGTSGTGTGDTTGTGDGTISGAGDAAGDGSTSGEGSSAGTSGGGTSGSGASQSGTSGDGSTGGDSGSSAGSSSGGSAGDGSSASTSSSSGSDSGGSGGDAGSSGSGASGDSSGSAGGV